MPWGFSYRSRRIQWISPSGRIARRSVAHGGVLDQLWKLSEDLSADYGWQEAQAVNFVLTGQVPLLPQIRSTVTFAGREAVERATITL